MRTQINEGRGIYGGELAINLQGEFYPSGGRFEILLQAKGTLDHDTLAVVWKPVHVSDS